MSDVKATVYIGTSLDGFIARENGALDFLDAVSDPGEDYGYAHFMSTVDALVMGRKTWETVRGFGAWPYGKTPVIVLSTKKVDIPRELAKTVTWMSGKVDAIVNALAARELHHLYVDGGNTIQRFLNAGAIQHIIISRIPILIGTGIPLFGKLDRGDVRLKHVVTRSFPSGLTQSAYEVIAAAPKRRTTKAQRKSRISKARKA